MPGSARSPRQVSGFLLLRCDFAICGYSSGRMRCLAVTAALLAACGGKETSPAASGPTEEGKMRKRPTGDDIDTLRRGGGAGFGKGGSTIGSSKSKLQTKIGAATVDGALDKSAIHRVMRSRSPALKRCYEHELNKDPSFTTELNALFTIGKGGRLSPITVDPAVSPSFTACLKGAIRAVRMPTAEGETEVSLPLSFKQ